MNEITIHEDGTEIAEFSGDSMAIGLTRAEIDQQVATARAYPRSLKRVKSSILSMVTLDEESAEECMYALPRGGKPIQGPSIRFAEALRQSFGNCRSAARVVNVDRKEKFIEAEGIFHDLETNTATMSRVRRRISNKAGALLTDDMIIVTGNAACSIALRNAILSGVPKPLWREAYSTVLSTIAGDVTTLSVSRSKAIAHFANFGVTPESIFLAMGVKGEDDITIDHIVTLKAMASSIKNGEATVEEMFYGTVKDREIEKPSIGQRLETARQASTASPAETEGFSKASVAAEAETLSTPLPASESTIPDTSSSAEEVSSHSSGANGDAGAPEIPSKSPALDHTPPDADEIAFMVSIAKRVFAGVGPDQSVVIAVADGAKDDIGAQRRVVQDKLRTVVKSALSVCQGKASMDACRSYCAGVIGCEEKEIS
jgi:hypothetical protein